MKMGITEFLVHRLRTIAPTYDKAPSPYQLLCELEARQWLFLLVAYMAWAWDAFDYFSIALIIPQLSTCFGKSEKVMALGLTFSLIPRFIGAAIFGIAADRFGRKWPLIFNNVLLIILEMALGFCKTYPRFLACRALFGVAMGGIYGNATATAVEDCPKASRGLVSGIYQSGYSMGCLLAAAFYTPLVKQTIPYGWRNLFFFGAGPPILIILFRLCLPETTIYTNATSGDDRDIRQFLSEFKEAVKRHWCLLGYLILFMAGCSFLSHGSQDWYPTMLLDKYSFPMTRVVVTLVVANVGSLLGSVVVGFGSQIIGRRFAIAAACTLGAALVYPYCFVSNHRLYPSVFFEQFFVQGIFGVVPIHLVELSPPAFKTFVVGTAYNLGILIASPIPVILAQIGENYPLTPVTPDGTVTLRYDYSIGMAIFLSCAFAYTIIITFLGPEKRGAYIEESETDNDGPPDDYAVEEVPNGRY